MPNLQSYRTFALSNLCLCASVPIVLACESDRLTTPQACTQSCGDATVDAPDDPTDAAMPNDGGSAPVQDAATSGMDAMTCTPSVFFYDYDGDGYGLNGNSKSLCVAEGLYKAPRGGDCNDQASNVHPGAPEVCNQADDNCANGSDEGLTTVFYYDFDGDGYGIAGNQQSLCAAAGLYRAAQAGDCNDQVLAIRPGASEVCNNVDDNCANGVDEGVKKTFYYDYDNDGYGVDGQTEQRCVAQGLYRALRGGDCRDEDGSRHPGARDIVGDCVDQNCNGADERRAESSIATPTWTGNGNLYQVDVSAASPYGNVQLRCEGTCGTSTSWYTFQGVLCENGRCTWRFVGPLEPGTAFFFFLRDCPGPSPSASCRDQEDKRVVCRRLN